jgi:hypothetical protein
MLQNTKGFIYAGFNPPPLHHRSSEKICKNFLMFHEIISLKHFSVKKILFYGVAIKLFVAVVVWGVENVIQNNE